MSSNIRPLVLALYYKHLLGTRMVVSSDQTERDFKIIRLPPGNIYVSLCPAIAWQVENIIKRGV